MTPKIDKELRIRILGLLLELELGRGKYTQEDEIKCIVDFLEETKQTSRMRSPKHGASGGRNES